MIMQLDANVVQISIAETPNYQEGVKNLVKFFTPS